MTMRAVAYLALSGWLFHIGLLSIVAAMASAWSARRAARIAQMILVGAGLLCVAAAVVPAPLWLYAGGAISLLGYAALVSQRRFDERARLRATAAMLTVTACLALLGAEAPSLCLPRALSGQHRIYLLGDSLSAPVAGVRVWPELLAERRRIAIVNLARPGILAGEAVPIARQIGDDSVPVLIELGGNDWRRRREAGALGRYREGLRSLLQCVCSGRRTVVMFEIPFPPPAFGFHRAQRSLAREFGVTLIPRRVLAHVWCRVPGATTDGIHLSPEGHRALARDLEQMLRTAD